MRNEPIMVTLWVRSPSSYGMVSSSDIRHFFAQHNKQVITFVGYSGQGYDQLDHMLDVAKTLLDRYDPDTTIVNIGATTDGIGAVYRVAKEKGFMTTGILSTRGADLKISQYVDHVFYVEDDTWGGIVAETGKLSPTSLAMVENSDVVIGIGGGTVAQEEMAEAKRLGKMVEFIAL